MIASYYYDPFGRRLYKEVGGTRTCFSYSDEGLIGEYDASGAEIKAYGWKPGSAWSTDPLFMKQGGQYYWYHNDHLGTPQMMTTSSGAVVWKAKYTSFGKATVDTSSTVINPLRLPGQYEDAETGFHYNTLRYYDPVVGRYVSSDPLGVSALLIIRRISIDSVYRIMPSSYDANDLENLIISNYIYGNSLVNPQSLLAFNYSINNTLSLIDPYGLLFGGRVNAGESYGEFAAQYWADRSIDPNNAWYETAFYTGMGLFASLWTPCTSDKTLTTLSVAYGIGAASEIAITGRSNWVTNNAFRWGRGRWGNPLGPNRLHFHMWPALKHHLPYQLKTWFYHSISIIRRMIR